MRGIAIVAIMAFLVGAAFARDDGRFAQSPLKGWFDSLKNKKGFGCCSDADGTALSDPDWRVAGNKYRVRLNGIWLDVPDEAVIEEPNRAGKTMVWPVPGINGTVVRCFIAGTMS